MNPERTERGHTNPVGGGLLEGDLATGYFHKSMILTALPGLQNVDPVMAVRAENGNVENANMWVTRYTHEKT